ncbi:MAG: insulinase family protein [Lachnospiraceae bacterium]|nr:insulinase family protein [Lachnospiraceae bacterium]
MRDIPREYVQIGKTGLGDIHSVGYILRHQRSGAKICIIENDDENKVFYIGFRTPPHDSTGVAHITEHSVLCGSTKYPVKDPFVELAKGSLNTFLNAMTYPDKTVYPVASTNDADFKNLMDVYMDAVLHPNIYANEEIFSQEGWHYEMEDVDSELTINGVVYNEMRGAFSNPDDVLSREILNSLYPDTAYSVESGGDPKNIPDLTYDDFLDFHSKYYHPSNAYIYLYGDMDFVERLEYLDREYLSFFNRIEVDSAIKKQEPFDKTRYLEKSYSIGSDEDTADKTFLSYNISVADNLDPALYQAMDILEYAMLTSPGAPIEKALLDAGIGKDIIGGYDSGIYQPYFSVVAKGANEADRDRFVQIIRDTLSDMAEGGIDKKALHAAINSSLFKYKEADFGSYPKGLMYGLQLLDSWIYDDNQPFMHLHGIEVLEDLKKKVDGGYFEDLIKTYLLGNHHATVLTLTPVPGQTAAEEEELSARLAEYKSKLSADEIAHIVEYTSHLKEYQDTPSTPEELATIPLLKRTDLKRPVRPLKNDECSYHGVKLLHHDIRTNGINYLIVCFDAQKAVGDDLPALSLMVQMMGMLDTADYTYNELSNEINLLTGGISLNLKVYPKMAGGYRFVCEMRMRYLYENAAEAMDLLKQMAFLSDFSDKKRVQELLGMEKLKLQNRITQAGHIAAPLRAGAYFSPAAAILDATSGIEYYRFLCDFEEHFEDRYEQFCQDVRRLMCTIFTKDDVVVSTTGDAQALALAKLSVPVLMTAVEELQEANPDVTAAEPGTISTEKKNEGFKTPSQVNYVGRAGDFKKAGYEYTGAMKILRTILSYDYFWINIRVKGGAYGCMSSFSRTGEVNFASYRDPQLAGTNDIFEHTDDYVREFDADERDMTKYIIGTVSSMDTPLTPAQEGTRSFTAYMTGMTIEQLQHERDQVIDATPADIQKLADPVRAILDQGYICAVGSESSMEADKDIFMKVENL